MVGKKRDSGAIDRLDQVGREFVRASGASEAETEAAIASPFLYARLRSRINAERGQREERESWLMTLKVFWRAVPVMTLVALFAVVLFLSANFGTGSSVVLSNEGLLDAGVEGVVFADSRNMDSDEVLATILNGDEQEASR